MRFQGKTVIVTGAGSGIGAATARRFGDEGAKVVLVARHAEGIEKVAAGLDNARVVAADITQDAERIVAAAEGRIDVLVNNAGIAVSGEIEELSPEDWDRQIRTNVTGTYLVTRAAWPLLKAARGNVVNTSSVSGIGGDWGMFAYNASKGAISNMTRALALDGAKHGIRVNAVNPALTASDMTEDMLDDAALIAKFRERMPLGAPAQPEDVAAVIAFLASEDARMVTGVNLPVDGGCLASNGQPPQA
ncbi:SDR family NAD(P)-dependent oxidoreductase [Cereibacter sp. SYSU M97828]|nr:SDR family NAD(P)-dependent oxidoreductase [Cereibacter flavus]